MNKILQQRKWVPQEIEHLTKIDKNNKFKMAATAILNFIYSS